MRKSFKLFLAAFALVITSVFALLPQNVHAEGASADDLYKWALLNMMNKCYSGTYMNKTVDASNYNTFSTAVLKGDAQKRKQSKFYITTKVGNAISDTLKVGCYEIFMGDPKGSGTYPGTMSGVFELYGVDYQVVGTDKVGIFLKGLGYTESSSGGGESESCIKAQYFANSKTNPSGDGNGDDVGFSEICWNNAKLNDPNNTINDFNDPAVIRVNNQGTTVSGHEIQLRPQPSVDGYSVGLTVNGSTIINNEIGVSQAATDGKISIDLIQSFDGKEMSFMEDGSNFIYKAKLSFYSKTDTSGSFSTYEIDSWKQANITARKYITGSSNDKEYHKFSDADKYDLYTKYLSNVYNIKESNAEECTDKKPSKAIEDNKYWLYTSGGWCRIAASDDTNPDAKVAGFTKSERRYLNTEYDLKGLLGALYDLNPKKVTPTDLDDIVSHDNDPEAGSNGCFDGAGALGWIICPILTGTADAINFIYEKVVDPFLQINAGLFSSENGSYTSWQIFQSFANIAFVIMLLFVIFSQLTGVGIDNYGIKKILPRLIISAVLINLSYIICQLLVDVSNILGVSLKNLFDTLASGVSIENTPVSGGATVLTGLVGVLAGGGALMALGGLGIILPLLLALITTFISILFVFVLLGARQAIVVVLVVISPLVFVCYMLPNTKKYFDKIVNLFASMLIIYPICGLLIGGGNFASKVILAAGSGADENGAFFFQLSAMLINIIPFFFIPSLVRNSFNAIGNIGSRVEGITRGAGARINRGVSNSEIYKDAMARSRAGIRADGTSTRFGNLRRRIAGSNNAIGRAMQRSMARGQTDVLKAEAEQRRAKLMTDPTHIEAMAAGERAEEMRRQISDQEMLIKDMTDSDGNYIANSPEKLGDMYTSSLRTLNDNPEDVEARNRVMALQNILSKTDAGRAQIQNRMENFVDNLPEGSETRGISAAAGHLLSEHGDTYKSKNRGFNNWISQAANGNVTKVGAHDSEGAQKYTAESLANADEEALKRLVRSYESGDMKGDDRNAISQTAREALDNPNIQVKPEVARYLRSIAGPSQPSSSGAPSNPGSGNLTDGQEVNIQTPTPNINASDLENRIRNAQRSSDGTLNIQGEGQFSQTDSGIIIPRQRGGGGSNGNS